LTFLKNYVIIKLSIEIKEANKMAKIGLTKLGLKKNTEVSTLEWNG
jgi:hypothetical protein